jgi:predicted metal-dependent peptidase
MVSKAKAKLSGKEWGDLPAGVQRMVDEICAPPKLPWKRLLRLFAGRGSRTVVRTTRHKESNRFLRNRIERAFHAGIEFQKRRYRKSKVKR